MNIHPALGYLEARKDRARTDEKAMAVYRRKVVQMDGGCQGSQGPSSG